MMTAIAIKEMSNATNGHGKIIHVRQEHNAEMIGGWAIKSCTLHNQYALFCQEIISKLLIIFDGIHFGIKSRKHVQR